MRALAMMLVIAVLVAAGCSNRSSELFEDDGPRKFTADERKEVQREIEQLAKGKDVDDAAGSAAYTEAVDKLTARGSKTEPQLVEALAGHKDWAVRMGVVEVLESVGTRVCVDALVGATKDPHPLVVLRANKLLEKMLGHRIIPAAGEAVVDGMPPVPARDPADLELDAEERIWAAWHREHAVRLHDRWLAWWKANRGTVKIQ